MNAPTTSTQREGLQASERQAEVVRALQARLPAHALIWQA
jgi:glycolate oxidase